MTVIIDSATCQKLGELVAQTLNANADLRLEASGSEEYPIPDTTYHIHVSGDGWHVDVTADDLITPCEFVLLVLQSLPGQSCKAAGA